MYTIVNSTCTCWYASFFNSTCRSEIATTPYLHLRYDGTDCALMISSDVEGSSAGCQHGDFEAAFTRRYSMFTLSS